FLPEFRRNYSVPRVRRRPATLPTFHERRQNAEEVRALDRPTENRTRNELRDQNDFAADGESRGAKNRWGLSRRCNARRLHAAPGRAGSAHRINSTIETCDRSD